MILSNNNRVFIHRNKILNTPWNPNILGGLQIWMESVPKFVKIEDSIEVINALISAFESSENNAPIEISSISEMQNHKKEWNFS